MKKKGCIKKKLSLIMVFTLMVFNFNLLIYAHSNVFKTGNTRANFISLDSPKLTTAEATYATNKLTASPQILVSGTTFSKSDTVKVTLSGASTDANAWIGLYNLNDTPGDTSTGGVNSMWWKYLSPEKPSDSLNIQDGNGTFDLKLDAISGVQTGKTYKLVLFKNGGYDIDSSVNFSILSNNSNDTTPKITLPGTTFARKDRVEVTLANASLDDGAWIGIYNLSDKPGKPSDGGVGSMWWKYISPNQGDSLNIQNGNGSFNLNLDTIGGITAGKSYKFVLFKDGGYNIDASANFDISLPPAQTFCINPVEIKTKAGIAPELPTVVTDTYSGNPMPVSVVWDNVAPYLYGKAGSFTVEGTVAGRTEKARADVTVVEGDGPLYTFQVLSDTHIVSDMSYVHDTNLDNALKDINRVDPGSSRLIIDGDITDCGLEKNWNAYASIVNSNTHPEISGVLGNHDTWQEGSWSDDNQYAISKQNFMKYTGAPGVYYDYWLGGNHFVILGSEKSNGNRAYLTDTQLSWFDKTLAQNAENNKPIFVFVHQPLYDTVAGSKPGQGWNDIEQDTQVRNILAKYPQAILFTGHTHWEFGSKYVMYNQKYCTMFNVPSCGYCWTDANTEDDISEGYFVDVYKDKVIVKGRNFTTREWEKNGQFEVSFAGTQKNAVIKAVDNFVSNSSLPQLGNISLTADKDSLLLGIDKGAKLTLNATMTDGTIGDLSKADDIEYSSDNPNIATVDQNGLVSAVGTGVANISARVTINGITASATLSLEVKIAKTDALLKSITIDGKAFSDFAPNTSSYQVELPNQTTKVPVVNAIAEDSDATITIKQAGSVSDTAVINVTAQDGTTTKSYSIKFYLGAPNTDKVKNPVFSLPANSTYTTKQQLSLSCPTEGAVIRYTLDGTDPNENSKIYNSPIELLDTTTVKAIAMKSGLKNSEIVSATYSINVPTPTPTPTPNPTPTPTPVPTPVVDNGKTNSGSPATKGASDKKSDETKTAEGIVTKTPGQDGKVLVNGSELQKAEGLVVKSDVSLQFDKTATHSLSGKNNVVISVKKSDEAGLSQSDREKIGDRPVYQFSVTSSGNNITSFDGGTVYVSIPYQLKQGEDPNAVVVFYINSEGKPIAVNCVYDEATGTVKFSTKHFSKYAIGYNKVNFNDVPAGSKAYVTKLAAMGIISGDGNGKFNPSDNITRAQVVKMLFGFSGEDEKTLAKYKKSPFTDVKASDWFAPYVLWAYDKGIVAGGVNNKFAPNQTITREQLSTILYKFIKVNGVTIKGTKEIKAFSDSNLISTWAKDAVQFMQSIGIINGKINGSFSPKGTATREEAAKVMALLIEALAR